MSDTIGDVRSPARRGAGSRRRQRRKGWRAASFSGAVALVVSLWAAHGVPETVGEDELAEVHELAEVRAPMNELPISPREATPAALDEEDAPDDSAVPRPIEKSLAGEAAPRATAPVPERRARQAALDARGAPLTSVLAHLVALEGGEARVADGIGDLVVGPLVGKPDELIALLEDAHSLETHREGTTIWFDRIGHSALDFVPLQRAEIVRALEALAFPLAPGGTVQTESSGRGLVLRGDRAYLRTSLQRIALATGNDLDAFSPAGAGSYRSPKRAGADPPPTPEALVERAVLISSRFPRFVELDNGERFGIGDALAEGWRLERIGRERLVCVRDGLEAVYPLP